MPETFTSAGRNFNITVYPPRSADKKYPILMLLHGNFGLGEPYGSQIQEFAKSLAGLTRTIDNLGETSVGLGYIVAVPDYYSDTDDHTREEDPGPHLQTLAAAIQHVVSRSDADPSRIGLIGYSLGAAIAMRHIVGAASSNVKVLVDYFGPTKSRFPEGPISPVIVGGIAKFPPTLTFHDAKDVVVPVDRSVELHQLLPSSTEHRLCVYVTEPVGAQNHAFAKDGYADLASRNEAARWIVKHMPPTSA